MSLWYGVALLLSLVPGDSPESPIGPVLFTESGLPPAYRPLDLSELEPVKLGQSLFKTQWVAVGVGVPEPTNRQGLGPLFNAVSCNTCHPNGAQGVGPIQDGPVPAALVIQLGSPPGKSGQGAQGDPVYGRVLNTSAVDGVRAEGVVTVRYRDMEGYYYPDGERWHLRIPHYDLSGLTRGPLASKTVIKPRLAPALYGVGLLEAVPASTINTKGRYGWQADAASIRDQTTRALAREMGLTSSDRPDDDCTSSEVDCLEQSSSHDLEVSEEQLQALLAFERVLAVPRSYGQVKNATLGSGLFVAIGCAGCHRPQLPVDLPDAHGERVSGMIAPYTDLQVHDLGVGMADEDVTGHPVASLWRTAPLWGLGYRMRVKPAPTFLHDGRAQSLEEAILWHSGEGIAARQRFLRLGPRSREALLRWLETL